MNWRVAGYVLIGTGVLVLLAPLASQMWDSWRHPAPPSRETAADSVMKVVPDPAPEPFAPPSAEPEREQPAPPAAEPPPPPAPPAPVPPPPTPKPAPPAAPQEAPTYRIEIPELGATYVVTEGIEDTDLDRGPGHYPRTPHPGEAGNAAIAGHRTRRGRPSFFYHLNRVKVGSVIRIHYPDRVLTFTVEKVFITHPYDRSVLAPTPYPGLTLTTCDPPGTDDNRLIIQARLTQTRTL